MCKQTFREKFDRIYKYKSYSDKDYLRYVFDSKLKEYTDDVIIPNRDKLPALYRFSPADYNNIRNLETGKLFLSPSGNQNDIFEGLSCPTDEKVIKNLKQLADLAYIKSFTETNKDLKMWNIYADNMSGMCVAYDVSKIEDNLIYHLLPVAYLKKRTINNKLAICIDELNKFKHAIKEYELPTEFDFLKDVMSLYTIKSPDWKNEYEWRLIVTFLQMNSTFEDVDVGEDVAFSCYYDIDKQLIDFPYATAVYLGPRMSSDKREHIIEIAERLNLKVYDVILSNDKYEVEFKEYKKENIR